MKNIRTFSYKGLFFGLTLLSIVGGARQVWASSSYTSVMTFYQGVDLNTGMTAYDPRALIIGFGALAEVERVVKPQDWAFENGIPMDFHFEFEPGTDFPVTLMTEEQVMVALLEDTSLDAVSADLLGQLDLSSELSGLSLDPDDTVVLLTADGTYFAFGDFGYDPFGWAVKLTVTQFGTIPEPVSILLLGLGLLSLGFIIRRIQPKN